MTMNERMMQITFKAYYDIYEKLDRLSSLLGVSRSEVIRRAIEHYYNLHFKEKENTNKHNTRVIVLGEV